jgi:hypothetical protein
MVHRGFFPLPFLFASNSKTIKPPTMKKKSIEHLNHWSLNNLKESQGFIEKCLVSLGKCLDSLRKNLKNLGYTI